MMRIANKLPAWLLKFLPVRLARQCAIHSPHIFHPSGEMQRQLLVDVSVICRNDAGTGIQRVVRSLLLQLMASPPIGYRVCPVFATRHDGYRHADPDFLTQSTQATRQGLGAVQVQNDDVFLGLDLAAHLLPRHQGQLLGWKRKGVKVHIVVYDLLPLQHPEWFNPKTTRNFKRWIKSVAVYADSAICISASVKTGLTTWLKEKFHLPTTALSTSTIVLGADIAASAPSDGLPADAEFLLARLRNTPAVLMVGTLEPRKGHDQALAAFEHLWQQPSPSGRTPLFIIVGRPGWKTDALQKQLRTHPQAGKRIFWFEKTSDEFLIRLYNASHGVLVASRAEGFGLPLVEAMLHNKPVLARDIPVFREIKSPGITYFNSETPQGLSKAIKQWLQKSPGTSTFQSTTNLYTWQLAGRQLIRSLGFSQKSKTLPVALKNSNSNRVDASA